MLDFNTKMKKIFIDGLITDNFKNIQSHDYVDKAQRIQSDLSCEKSVENFKSSFYVVF